MSIDDYRKFIFEKLQLSQHYLIKQVKSAQSDSIDLQKENNSVYQNVKDTFEIIKKEKYSKLTKHQIIFLKSIINYSNDIPVTISQYYGVSLSTLNRIKNMK